MSPHSKASISSPCMPHAQAGVSLHSRDGQMHARFLAVTQVCSEGILRCHGHGAMACPVATQCQPQQNSVTQTCKRGQCQFALFPCCDSSRGMSTSEGIPERLFGLPMHSHSPALSMTMFSLCTWPTACAKN